MKPDERFVEQAREIVGDTMFDIVSMAANLGMSNPRARADIARAATTSLEASIASTIQQAVEEETERCAKVALKTELAANLDSRIHELNSARHQIAQAIRKRISK